MNQKIQIGIVIGCLAVGAIFVGLVMKSTMQINDTMSSAFSTSEPDTTQIRQMCTDKLNELAGAEYATPMAVNICVGTVLDGLNK